MVFHTKYTDSIDSIDYRRGACRRPDAIICSSSSAAGRCQCHRRRCRWWSPRWRWRWPSIKSSGAEPLDRVAAKSANARSNWRIPEHWASADGRGDLCGYHATQPHQHASLRVWLMVLRSSPISYRDRRRTGRQVLRCPRLIPLRVSPFAPPTSLCRRPCAKPADHADPKKSGVMGAAARIGRSISSNAWQRKSTAILRTVGR